MTGEHLVVQDVGWSVDGLSIIDGVCLRAPAGTVTGLLGPNGSGKSTLLSVAAAVRRPGTGVVRIGGDELHALNGRVRAQRVALLEQQATTDLDLCVEDVVDLGRTPYRSRWGAGDPAEAAIIANAMTRADIAHLRGRRWLTLSGGERQRVQLARALAQQPSVLLMDEPTNHLDLRHQIELLRLVRRLGITVLAALHDLDHALAFCDLVIVLCEGRVVAAGEPREVVTAELLHDVYGVRAAIVDHPLSGRPHLVWDER